jgi:C1A family cysteine protease
MPCARSHILGWQPDVPDHRDYWLSHDSVKSIFRRLKVGREKSRDLPEDVDWREYCGPVEDQRELPTSSAHAGVALVQYFERRSSGRLIQPSRLFVHQAACRIQQTSPTCAASLRNTFKAMIRCGCPPERYWPYDEASVACQGDAFLYGFRRQMARLRYLRLDYGSVSGQQIVERARSFVAAGFALAVGFPLGISMSDDAEIAFPTASDVIVGSHAACVVGYDDRMRIRSDKGALLLRNSWGKSWGDGGYGWLPYSYLKQRLAVDLWTLLRPPWLESGEFAWPSVV